MSPTDLSKALTDLWATQVQVWLNTQEHATKAMAEGIQAMTAGAFPARPEMPADLSAGMAELSRAGQSLAELWSAATSSFGALGGAFTGAAPSAAAAAPPVDGDTAAEAALRTLLDPQTWLSGMGEVDGTLGRLAEGPRLADLWEVERRYARVMQAWIDVRRRGLEHNAVLLEAWTQASRRFSAELAGRTSADGRAPDAKAALALWTETANERLLETQRSEPFLKTQAAMIRASTQLSLAQQELVEHFGRQYGFPTRTELDDVHRSLTELRRELRTMQRQQRSAPASVTGAQGGPEPQRAPELQTAAKPRMAPPRRPAPPRKGVH